MQRAGRSDLAAGRSNERTGKASAHRTEKNRRWSGRLSRSSSWLVARNDKGPVRGIRPGRSGHYARCSGKARPGCSCRLRKECERDWEVHRGSTEELVFVLSGPCSRAGLVVLDPSVEIFDGRAPGVTRLEPRRFSGVDRLQKPVTISAARKESRQREGGLGG